jgi:hypothetical protein
MTCAACGHPIPTNRGEGREPLCRDCFAAWAWVAFRPTGYRRTRPMNTRLYRPGPLAGLGPPRHPRPFACPVCGAIVLRGWFTDCGPCHTWFAGQAAVARFVRAWRAS